MSTPIGRELRLRLAETLRRVQAGETIDVTDHGRPVARLVLIEAPRATRRPGSAAGRVAILDGFDDVDGEIADAFAGE